MKTLALAVSALALVAGAARAETATYAIDPTHTAVIYEIAHFGTSTNRGRFQAKEGTVQLDRAGKSGKVEVSFDVTKVDTGVAALDKHLQSADFFDVAKFPSAKFVADKFTFDGDKVTGVSGQLTLKDVTKPVSLKTDRFNCYVNPMFKREVCGGDFETTVQRSQWGVDWGLKFGFVDDVHLEIQIEAIKQ